MYRYKISKTKSISATIYWGHIPDPGIDIKYLNINQIQQLSSVTKIPDPGIDIKYI